MSGAGGAKQMPKFFDALPKALRLRPTQAMSKSRVRPLKLTAKDSEELVEKTKDSYSVDELSKEEREQLLEPTFKGSEEATYAETMSQGELVEKLYMSCISQEYKDKMAA